MVADVSRGFSVFREKDGEPLSIDLDTYRPKVRAFLLDVNYPDGRLAGQSRVICCPFCEREHSHGDTLGSRTAHCLPALPTRGGHLKTSDAYGNPGYELCDPAAEGVNWDLECLYAQLWVTRSKYRRLRAEHDRMDPWSAREKRVKQTLAAQADELGAVLRAAGVAA
ncbi:hypothetical protein [Streptomyces stelliscabiei]|uniref:hypothetical protein n=1 Tax=Streptomyces stelliscabiei TaxID=146820 RepID=UPI00299FB814|nr:hypothetical protein [Streptomyces stelliscabiei]MDX2550207.1 hypothetical protein [Streptomyces stelliscabiei]MDX2610494.1 hypothetical protein [Streptomyces stelliscabiei]MDX2635417.1 hypothetical protein [Streptomyces stelliscabiei]MDX2665690.1 hypothetical protein [Streptomyces stelliscabiei]MDX2710557.1 hypothetical protein [Streptomyces stelliscabiei]